MKDLLNKIAFIIGNFIMAGFFIYGAYRLFSLQSVGGGNGAIMLEGVLTGLIIIACGVSSGLLFYLLYIRKWTENFFDLIYSPNNKYKSLQPNILSILGLIQKEQYENAKEKLEKICQEHPLYSDAVFMLFNLYFEKLKDYESAYLIGRDFFSHKKTDKNIDFLFRYSDLLNLMEATDENLQLLQRELKKSHYSNHEKKMISLRIKYLQK